MHNAVHDDFYLNDAYKVTFGSTVMITASSTQSGSRFTFQGQIANRGATNLQVGTGWIMSTTTIMTTSTLAAEDTTTDLDLVVSMIQTAYSTIIARVETVLIEIIK